MQRDIVEHLDELIKLWEEVFKDDDSFLVPFLAARRDTADVYYTKRDGKIVSAIWYLKADALIDSKVEEVRLIAGVATDKEYREQGLMAELIASSRKNYTCPLVLYPAVRKYYEKNGFYSSSKALTFTLDERELCFTDDYSINDMNSIYTSSIKNKGGLLRDAYAWHSILEDHYLIRVDEAYALYSPVENRIIEAAAATREGAEALLSKLGGKVTAIPASEIETLLLKEGYNAEETMLGMCSQNIDIYIAEQY